MSKIPDEQNGQASAGLPDKLKEELEATRKMTEGTFTADETTEGDKPDEKPEDKPAEKPTPADNAGQQDGDGEGDNGGDDDGDGNGKQDDDGSKGNEKPNDTDRKVVPIKLLHDKERERKEAEGEATVAKARVAELEGIIAGNKQGSQKEADAVKQWAEKHGYEPEGMEELVSIIRATSEVDQETLIKNVFGKDADLDTIKGAIEFAKSQNEKAAFVSEFETFEPELKKQFPDATPEQIAKARTKLDTLSHSKDWHDKDLDYIVYKNKDEFEGIFSTPAGTDEKPPVKKGPEGGRFGQNGPTKLTAKDFSGKNGKSFDLLAKMPEAERNQIVAEFDPFQKIEYWQSLGSNNSTDVIKRGGQRI